MEARRILRNNPAIDVNWCGYSGETALHAACNRGYKSVADLLLAHPDVNVNQGNVCDQSPFWTACERENPAGVRILLRDSRVKVDRKDSYGETPLCRAISEKNLETVKWWIASGRELDLGEPNGGTDLLKRFKENREETRDQIRRELGITGKACCT